MYIWIYMDIYGTLRPGVKQKETCGKPIRTPSENHLAMVGFPHRSGSGSSRVYSE